MATYYIRPTNGSDSNDGLDFFGFNLSGATFTNATKNLNKTGAFSSYTYNDGDKIYISGGTGVTTGLYPIASKTDNDNIVLEDNIGGSNPTDVTSSNGAWKTTQKALDTAVGNDVVRACNEANETPSARVDIDTNAGGVNSPIVFIGCDSTNGTELDDGEFYVLSGSSLPANTDLLYFNIADLVIKFKKFRFTAATDRGLYCQFANYIVILDRCRVDNNSDAGIYNVSTNGYWRLIDCELDNNGAEGVNVNSAGRGNFVILGGSAHDNSVGGIHVGGDAGVVCIDGVRVYGNTGAGIYLDGADSGVGGPGTVMNCTVYDHSAQGIVAVHAYANFINNTIVNCAGGIVTLEPEHVVADYNHYHNNTGSSNAPGDHDQTGDPLWTDAAGGDFTPKIGSPLIGNGLHGRTIGALEPLLGGSKLVGDAGGLVG